MKAIYRWVLAAALLCAAPVLRAVPADPTPFKYTQPDGSVVTLRMHGDEWCNWTSDMSGTIVALEKDGFYRAVANPEVWMAARREEGRRLRAMAEQVRSAALRAPAPFKASMTEGTRHIPVILLEFSDLRFTISNPAKAFEDMLNKEGYSDNNAIGSVRDFYRDNSNGKFNPVFDVYGPVNINQPHAQYGENAGTEKAAKAFDIAVGLLDKDINFKDYDYDSDGYVDMILFYYAGHNVAEGASANTIWPHQWWFTAAGINKQYDGKRLGRYFCTSELKGSYGTTMCSIGTTCHEFGHSLGLPDFYDTDYADNGYAGGLYSFSTMCSGSYNANSTKPPYFNVMERSLLGWCDEPAEITASGDYSLRSVRIADEAYSISTTTDGEIMIFECRDQNKWDSALPTTGMLVYHLDRSRKSGRLYPTPYNQWYNWETYNSINAYGNHPCFYIIPAATTNSSFQNQYTAQALNYNGNSNRIIFPGYADVTQFAPVDWEKAEVDFRLSNIRYSDGVLSFKVQSTKNCTVIGSVTNEAGKAVSGATVKWGPVETTTGTDGSYQLVIDASYLSQTWPIQVIRKGYETLSQDFRPTLGSTVTKDFILKTDVTMTIEYYGYNNFGGFFIGQAFQDGDVIELSVSESIPDARKPESVKWSYDGTMMRVTTLTLTAGHHCLAMILTFADGTSETVEYEFDVL